jgi:hypothetical protein
MTAGGGGVMASAGALSDADIERLAGGPGAIEGSVATEGEASRAARGANGAGAGGASVSTSGRTAGGAVTGGTMPGGGASSGAGGVTTGGATGRIVVTGSAGDGLDVLFGAFGA